MPNESFPMKTTTITTTVKMMLDMSPYSAFRTTVEGSNRRTGR
jgi:hypothetical protein